MVHTFNINRFDHQMMMGAEELEIHSPMIVMALICG